MKLLASTRSKYRAQGVHHEDGYFHSKAELARWLDLKNLQRSGQISELERQVRIPLTVNGHLICNYVADFCYLENDQYVYEDRKGFETPEFKLKKKLFEATQGKELRIT